MHCNYLKRIILCALCVLFMLSCCACKPHIDQDFVNLNAETQPPTTQPSEVPTIPEPTIPAETQPTFKPGGLVLPDEPTTAPSAPIEQTEPTTTPEATEPPTSTGGNIGGVKISSGLKAALNSLGKTNYGQITALQPAVGADGSNTIIHIKNHGNTAQQYTYMYYESKEDYKNATNDVSENACNNKLRLILRGETEVLPVTNPETMGIVLFDGYLLWR